MFPEELLQAVVEQLAYNPQFLERQLARFRWKYARSDLISLSMANHQLRRICMPFLFTYVYAPKAEDLEKLKDQCIINTILAASIRYGILY